MTPEDHNRFVLQELRDRAVRIESRIVNLGDYLGANLRTHNKVVVTVVDELTGFAALDGMDVSLSRMINEAKRAGLRSGASVPVYFAGDLKNVIATINL